MGVAAVMGTVALFTLIVDRQWGEQARAGAVWFAAAATVSLYSGRLTFALGVLLATAAVFAAQPGQTAGVLVVAGAAPCEPGGRTLSGLLRLRPLGQLPAHR